MTTEGMQGAHGIPQQIADKFSNVFDDYLPGWNVNGGYNLSAQTSTQMASLQLNKLLHSGPHPWINQAIEDLLTSNEFLNDAGGITKTQRLAALVNFMTEAGNVSNGAKTGGYIAFANLRDPILLKTLGEPITQAAMIEKVGEQLQWSKILASPAGQAAIALNPVVQLDASGKKLLTFSGTIDNGGFFSKSYLAIDLPEGSGGWKIYSSSTEYAAEYAAKHGIKIIDGGAVRVKGSAVNYANAFDTLDEVLGDGSRIGDFNRLSKTFLKKFGGVVLSIAAVIALSSSANAAQAEDTYDPVKIVPANKALISEVFGVAIGGLAGFVAGLFAGAASVGVLAIPVGIGASYVGEEIGKGLGNLFYDLFPELGNEAAEWIAPLLAPVSGFAGDVTSAIFEFVSDAFTYIPDLITGVDGVFGLDGALFGAGGPLHSVAQFFIDKGYLTEEGTWAYDGLDAIIHGSVGDDILIHDGWGAAYGGSGNDVLVGIVPVFKEAGEPLFDGSPSPTAQKDEQLELDGGDGDDWVITIGGEKAVTIGGKGRDWIFNTSKGGVIYGDTENGQDEFGNPVPDNWDNSDNIWWWPGTTLVSPGGYDQLKLFGFGLTGGSEGIPTILAGAAGFVGFAINEYAASNAAKANKTEHALEGRMFTDNFLFNMNYVFKWDAKANHYDMYVANAFTGLLELLFGGPNAITTAIDGIKGAMKVANYKPVASAWGASIKGQDGQEQKGLRDLSAGALGMKFALSNPYLAALALLPPIAGLSGAMLGTVHKVLGLTDAGRYLAKFAEWVDEGDPLILDLDGDGIETAMIGAGLRFDHDGNLFAEETGWLGGDDGFLVLDGNGNGRVDDGSEFFGGAGLTGVAELAQFDSNADGTINAADIIWNDLQVWRDADEDAMTDEGELLSLDDLGITVINLAVSAVNARTPQGTALLDKGAFTWASGGTGLFYDAVFQTSTVDTKFTGEAGRAAWLEGLDIDARGFGEIVDLSVAMSNDFAVGETVSAASAAMTTPKLKTLLAQAGEALGQWGQALELTRELVAVKLAVVDGKTVLADRAIYVEDAGGGYWTLKSGAAVVDGAGQTRARATLEDVLAQGSEWRLEQMFSPSTRGAALTERAEAPYLVRIENGRAVILDHGIENGDGSWRLASGAAIVDAQGNVIAAPTVADIRAQAHAVGTEWRVEEIGFNPIANVPVQKIGVRIVDGVVVDYTIEVTDELGSFYIWARNLDYAAEDQHYAGVASGYNLRKDAVDLAGVGGVGSTDDSHDRIEVLTPAQFNFATSLGGVDFRPEMLSATYNNATGQLHYSVNETGNISLGAAGADYVSGIKTMIQYIGVIMEEYLVVSRAFAVRMALQGGLSEFARGITYDVTQDKYVATQARELVPMFEAIFEAAPAGFDAAQSYLKDWNEILWQVYPDYKFDGSKNQYGTTMAMNQPAIMQFMLAAYENVAIDLDIPAVMDALGVDEEYLRRTVSTYDTISKVMGTKGIDYFYLSGGNLQHEGGFGSDFYFAGRDFGQDVIYDFDDGDADELRFAQLTPDDIEVTRVGEDLIIKVKNSTDELRIKDQFLGELNPYFMNGKPGETGVNSIIFANGVIWDRFRMAFEVADPKDTNDTIRGSGSADVLWGGKGNDVLRGHFGGDIYVYARGDGQDTIGEEGGTSSFGPIKAGIDFLQFRGDITADDLHLTRAGRSDDLFIQIKDKQGNITSDSILVEDQFNGLRLNFEAFGAVDPGLGLKYLSMNQIERLIFEDGTSLEFDQIAQRVIDNARTTGADAIYGMLNDNSLDGGSGDDLLRGFEGSDTYVFGRGYGQDVVEDQDYSLKWFGESPDTLQFKDDIRWTDVEFLRDGSGDDLTLRIRGSNDQVTMVDFLEYEPLTFAYFQRIETIEFGGGTTWDWLKLLQHYISISQTSGDDAVYGFETVGDTLDGGAGNDVLEGFSGNDVYVFARGYGHDTVLDAAAPLTFLPDGVDRIVLRGINADDVTVSRTDVDLVFTIKDTGETLTLKNQYVRNDRQSQAVEYFEFADRIVAFTDLNPEDVDLTGSSAGETLRGSNFAETIDGRAGDDVLIGGDGGDNYLFGAGYGDDVILDRRAKGGWQDRKGIVVPVNDSVMFGDGITQDDVSFARDGNDLVVYLISPGHTDTLRIRDQFLDTLNGVERFVFGNGDVLSISDVEDIVGIVGSNRGDNSLVGNLHSGNVFDGQQGDDDFTGGFEADSYAFTTGYDLDRIIEQLDANSNGALDKIVFGASVSQDDLILRRSGDDLLIDLGGGVDVLTIVNGLSTSKVEVYDFAFGDDWDIDYVMGRLLIGTPDDDQLVGFDGRDDHIDSHDGSDAMAGKTGNDVYSWGFGDGADSIDDSGGTDTLKFKPGVTIDQVDFSIVDGDLLATLKQSGERLVILSSGGTNAARRIEFFDFDGDDTLSHAEVMSRIRQAQSNAAQDTVQTSLLDPEEAAVAGQGFDTIYLATDRKISFSEGDGVDSVNLPGAPGTAEIQFAGLNSTDAVFRISAPASTDIIVSFPATGDQLVLLDGLSRSALPLLVFADGTRMDRVQVIERLVADQSSAGNDTIRGSALADVIDGGAGDDDISGVGGDDTYVFTRGDGRDVIVDSSGVDTLKVFGYTFDDLVPRQPVAGRNEIVLTFKGSNDEITLRYDAALSGVEKVLFADGRYWLRDQLFAETLRDGTPFEDDIIGTTAGDSLEGLAGNDTLRGNAGSDTYTFTRGDGRDIIDDQGLGSDINELFIHGYHPDDVTPVVVADRPNDLILRMPNGDEIVVVNGMLTNGKQISFFRFDNGGVWDAAGVRTAVAELPDESGGRKITGSSAADQITGTSGDDYLSGGQGNDTYHVSPGGGRDMIEDNSTASAADVLRLHGVQPGDVTLRRSAFFADGLEIYLGDGTDSIFIPGGLATTRNLIESIVFDDTTTWSLAMVREKISEASETDGADIISGTAAAEPLRGGKGVDVLSGLGGDDTYIFNAGDGHDVIFDNGASSGDILQVHGYGTGDIQYGISAITADSIDLVFGNGDAITIRSGLSDNAVGAIEQFQFDDGPLSLATLRQNLLAQQTTAGNDRIYGSGSADSLSGGGGDDTVIGLDGGDTYTFARGDGRLIIDDNGSGDTDVLRLIGYVEAEANYSRAAWPDQTLRITFTTSDDEILIVGTLNGSLADQIERIDFDDQQLAIAAAKSQIPATPSFTTRTGTAAADTLTSTAADELLTGLAAADTYVYARGGGNDVVFDNNSTSTATDRLVFSDIASTEVRVVRQDSDAILLISETAPGAGDGGSVLLRNAIIPNIREGVEQIAFSDGVTWTLSMLRQEWLAEQGSASGASVTGTNDGDTMVSGQGSDTLDGGSGNDTYYYSRGQGDDVIVEAASSTDSLILNDVASTEVAVSRVDNDAILIIAESAPGAGDGSVLRLSNGFGSSLSYGLESIHFADGVTWTQADVLAHYAAGRDAAGGQVVQGSSEPDILQVPTSPVVFSYLTGGEWSDTYVFQHGDGRTIIDDEGVADTDVLRIEGYAFSSINFDDSGLGFPTDGLRLTFDGTTDEIFTPHALTGGGFNGEIERIEIAGGPTLSMDDVKDILVAQKATSGNDWIKGYNSAEVFTGGAGDDTLEGLAGADEYHYSRGDGFDVIVESGNEVGDILYIHGVSSNDVVVRKGVSNDLELLIAASGPNAADGGRITVRNSFAVGTAGIEQVVFDDSTIWSRAGFDGLSTRNLATNDSEAIPGTSGNDTLEGKKGDDLLKGLAGDDSYVFHRGDGADTISDAGSGLDRIIIHGYAANEVQFTRRGATGLDLIIRLADQGDEITVVGGLDDVAAGQIEQVVLADSATTFDLAAVRTLVLQNSSTVGDDLIIGTDLDDSLVPGAGDDMVSGAAGNDTFTYRRGDGDDRIADTGGGNDRLVLPDYNVADIVFAMRAGPESHDLIIRFSGSKDRVILEGALAPIVSTGVDSITFADGTVWSRSDMRANAISYADTLGFDNIHGFSTDDLFVAKAGDDFMSGKTGSDTYRFARGHGNDTIEDTGTSVFDSDVVSFLDFVSTEVSVQRLFKGSSSVVFTFTSSSGDSLTVIDALAAGKTSIESYTFSDGVTWDRTDILTLLDNRAPVAVSDGYYNAVAGEPVTILASVLLRNDFDADNDALRIVAVDGGSAGTAQLDANGNIVFTPAAGFTGAAQFSYTVSDGRNAFAETTVDVRVRPVALAHDDSGFVVAEDNLAVIRVERLLSNDADGDRMVVGEVFGAINGAVSLSTTGDITFTPTANFNGVAQFTYAANTPEGGRAEAVVTITVTADNDAPVAVDNSGFTTLEDVPFQIEANQILANDRDVDGDVVSISAVHSNANVDVSLTADGIVIVTPRNYFWGNAYFDYTVRDAAGLTDTGRVNFYVTPVNNAPEAAADLVTTDEGAALLEDFPLLLSFAELLANDTDVDADPLAITGVKQAFGGHVELLDNNTILFTPIANFNGDARFTYVVSDGQGGVSEATATLRYQPVNDIPVARNDHHGQQGNDYLRGQEDAAIEIPIAELLQNDSDPEGLTVSFGSFANAVHGTVVLTDHGTLIFTPDPDFWGAATFSYLVTDPEGAVDDALVTLWFANVDDAPPVAQDDHIQILEDTALFVPFAVLYGNDYDIDSDLFEFLEWRPRGVPETSANVAAELNAGIVIRADGIEITPHLNSTVSAGFEYRITDNKQPPGFVTSAGEAPTGGASNWATVFIDMVAVDDDPTAANDSGFVTPFNVPLVLRVSTLLANDFDVDDDGDAFAEASERFAFSGVVSVSAGAATVETAGGEQFIVVRLPAGFTGDVSIEYQIADTSIPLVLTDSGFVSASVSETYATILNGTAGADWLEGNALSETIAGLAGDDVIVAQAGDDIIAGGDGADDIRGGDGDDIINGGAGADAIDGGDGVDAVDFDDSSIQVRADLESRVGQGGTAQGDNYLNIENLLGSRHSDILNGDGAANRIEGRAGADRISGRGGADALFGGSGDDMLEGGAQGDVMDGGDGSDTADYFLSSDSVQVSLAAATAAGGDATGDSLISIENLSGSEFADNLTGDENANILYGRRGDDVLVGGAGNDTLIGGQGADDLQGGDGEDIADYTLSAQGVAIDLANLAASQGDATGDTFSSIEIIQGSHQADQLFGNEFDNRFRGGDGADLLDGRGGFDTADYSNSDDAVSINLLTGSGSGADATGDTLVSIEKVIGSGFADTLTGSAADDVFDGGYGNDLLMGGHGSDSYVFGPGSLEDTITEVGLATNTDRLVMASGVRPMDVSLTRQGDNLYVEMESSGGLLVDSMLVTDHFFGRETGIEEIVFADGTVWDRQNIEDMLRAGRFNALNDLIRFADEDLVEVISPQLLFANDAAEGLESLALVSVSNAVHGTVSIANDGSIHFQGDSNYNGDAFFDYTVADQFGRQSTARVEVNLAPVNDAPTGVADGVLHSDEDVVYFIPYSLLLGNDTDIDGDSLSISGLAPLYDVDGNPLYAGISPNSVTNGTAKLDGGFVKFTPKDDFFGFAGFTYTLRDAGGLTSTATVELFIDPVNDAPRSHDDRKTIRLDTTTTISVSSLMANDYDVEGDAFEIVGVHSANNGTLVYDAATGVISFTPEALGAAAFKYDLVDARGAARTIDVTLDVIPLNDAPNARNDGGFTTTEDTALVISVAELLANDHDENGDLLSVTSVERFPLNGKVTLNGDGTISFVPRTDYNGNAGFKYTISDGRGGVDTAFVAISVMPQNDGPVLHDDIVQGFEDTAIVIIPGLAFGNDVDPDGDVLFFESVSLIGGIDQSFADREAFSATLGQSDAIVLDASGGTFSATLASGRTLPAWLSFDAEMMSLGFTDILPDEDAQPVLVRVHFTPEPEVLPNGTIASSTGGFAIEFLVDPSQPIDPAINSLLADALSADGEFAIDLGAAGSVGSSLENFGSLPSWLAFDAETLTFSGLPPQVYVGAVPVRIDVVGDGNGLPNFSVITDLVVDASFTADESNDPDGLHVELVNNRIQVTTPEDFNGPLALAYHATDTRGGVSLTPGIIVVNVLPMAERPDTTNDDISAVEDQPVTFTLAQLLANDRDDDGDAIRAIAIQQPGRGSLAINLATVEIDGAALLAAGPAAVFAATLADGSALPTWLEINSSTGMLSATVPLDVLTTLEIVVSASDGVNSWSVSRSQVFDGNAGVTLTYHGGAGANGADSFTYTITDDKQGITTGQVNLTIAAVNDPPAANNDLIDGFEDTEFVISFANLTANDVDVDGDPLTVISVLSASHGSVRIENGVIIFTPEENFDGTAGFDYVVSDGTDGSATGHVTLNVTSTNRKPVTVVDLVSATEDTPVQVSIANLLGNDFDPDADAFSFVSIQGSVTGARSFIKPGGMVEFQPDENVNGVVTFTYQISDGRLTSSGEVKVNFAPVNDAPIINTEAPYAAVEDTVLVISLADLIANDVDVEGDSFSVVAVFDGDNGSVVLDGVNALFTPRTDYFGNAGFTYRVRDAGGAESEGYVSIAVIPQFDAPLPVADRGLAMDEGGFIDIDPALLLANDHDPDGTGLVFVSLAGAVAIGNGMWRFTPAADFFGPASLTYQVTNASGMIVASTVTIDVLPLPDSPVAGPDSIDMVEDVPAVALISTLLQNDFDVDLDAVMFSRVVSTSGLTVVADGQGRLLLSAPLNANGVASFVYEVTDFSGRTAAATVTVNIAELDDAPVIGGMEDLAAVEDQPFSHSFDPRLFSDVDGDFIEIGLRGAGGRALPDWLSFNVLTLTVAGTPPANFNGTLALELTATDGSEIAVRPLALVIAPVNDAPVIGELPVVSGNEDEAMSVTLSGTLFTDVDADALNVAVSGANGSMLPSWLSFDSATLTLSGTPPAHFHGDLVLQVAVSDGTVTTVSPWNVQVSAVNDAPVIGPLPSAQTAEDQPFSVTLDSALFSDVDGDALSISVTGPNGEPLPDWLSFDTTTLTLSGQPPGNFNGDVILQVSASDGQATVITPWNISIAPVNDVPVIAALPDPALQEDAAVSISLNVALFSDADGDDLAVSVVGGNGAALPSWLSFDSQSLTLSGTPPLNFHGPVTLQVTVNDGSAITSRPWVITMSAVNDTPVSAADAFDGGRETHIVIPVAQLLANDSDVDGDSLTITSVSGGIGYTAVLDGLGNVVIDRDRGLSGVLPVSYTVSDGVLSSTGVVNLQVQVANQAPVISVIAPLHTAEDGEISLTLPEAAFSDPDGDVLTYSVTRAGGTALPGWLSFNPQTRQLTGTPPANFNGTLALQVLVSDGVLSATQTFDFVVDPVNDLPTLAAPLSDRFVAEDLPFTVTLQNNLASDVDGDPLIYSLKMSDGSALPNWLTFNANTLALSGQAPQNYIGTTQLRLFISDGTATISDDFAFTVSNSNDAPVLVNPLADRSFSTGAAFSIALPTNTFSDPDGDALQYAAQLTTGQALPTWLSFNGTALSGTAPAAGTWNIRIFATDGTFQATDEFVLTIAGGNSVPVAVNDGVFVTRSGVPIEILASQLLTNDTDADQDLLQVVEVRAAQHGTVSLANGIVTYQSASGYTGTDSFIYKVSDGVRTAEAVVVVGVTAPPQESLTGGNGTDIINGGNGADYINGGNGVDILFGGNGADVVFGGGGVDLLFGENGNDSLYGQSGNDILFGDNGGDFLAGGTGDDLLTGGNGADTFLFRQGDGSDIVLDFRKNQGDRIQIDMQGIDTFDDLLAVAQQQNGGVLFAFETGDELFLVGTQLAALDRNNFTFY